MSELALLVLESPWNKPKDDPERLSVLPFIKSLEQLERGFTSYYSTFYDTRGFATALNKDLCHTSEKRQIVYVAAHGSETYIAEANAPSLLGKIGITSKKIKGVIIGSCSVGVNFNNIEAAFTGDVRWVFSYTTDINWFSSAMVDLSIINQVSLAGPKMDKNKNLLLCTFAQALGRFAFGYPVSDRELLLNGFKLVYKSGHTGKLVDLTDDLIEMAWPRKLIMEMLG